MAKKPGPARSGAFEQSRQEQRLPASLRSVSIGLLERPRRSDATFQRISIKHSGFNPDSVIEASFKVLCAVPDIMNKVQLFQDRILTDAERLALATGAAMYRWEDPNKAPVNASMLLNARRYGDDAKDLWTTLNKVQENIIRGSQRDYSRRRPHGRRMPKSRAIKGIDEDMKLNKALWQMAEILCARETP